MKSVSFLISIFICTCVFTQSLPSIVVNKVDTHLGEHSAFNKSHHDSIDDEPHTHTHKHSEDGEEHEHKHEHTKITQGDSQILSQNHIGIAQTDNYETSNNFFENSLVSDPHSQGIFRPPIA